jgi:hypothetical protein
LIVLANPSRLSFDTKYIQDNFSFYLSSNTCIRAYSCQMRQGEKCVVVRYLRDHWAATISPPSVSSPIKFFFR